MSLIFSGKATRLLISLPLKLLYLLLTRGGFWLLIFKVLLQGTCQIFPTIVSPSNVSKLRFQDPDTLFPLLGFSIDFSKVKFWGMPHSWHNDNLYSICVALLIYTPNLHYKHRELIKGARYLGHRLLSGIKNDFIFKFSLFLRDVWK